MKFISAQDRILEKNRMIFLLDNRIYTAHPKMFVNKKGQLTAFQLFHYVHDLFDLRTKSIDEKFIGVMLPKNQEIAFYHYIKRFK